ncbi:MAG: 30S ribosomal protein S17 [Patescibacteria group bacterium]|nr:30S ribosomal protein S17 [Patescibacteria group bacterium]
MLKQLIGKIISVKMAKTVVVDVETKHPHPLYRKMLKKNKHYKAHNDIEGLAVGDKVKIGETKPISKEKTWKVVEKI